MAFLDYVAELASIPRLPYPFALTLINRAWTDIMRKRLWSFNIGVADIVNPAEVTVGTVTFTEGSATATADSTATAAFNAIPIAAPYPPFASPTLGQGYQIRTASNNLLLSSNGPLYNVVAWNGSGTLTLDRAFAQVTGSYNYLSYKAYYATPTTDFLRYQTLNNTTQSYSIRGRRLFFDQAKLNAYDPQRGGTGDSYVISVYNVDSNGNMVHEWYPHPVNLEVWRVYYERRGTPLSVTQDLPSNFSQSLLMARAYMHAADWAMSNIALFPELGNTNWVQFKKMKEAIYLEEMRDAIRQDSEIFPSIPVYPNAASQFPLGGQFLQSHDVASGFLA